MEKILALLGLYYVGRTLRAPWWWLRRCNCKWIRALDGGPHADGCPRGGAR